ncbi:response regulator [Paenibacillus yanchengensis]|uniref:Response regulator n=1 Tax=Paenibacillus yanchengensis TaxID=2035833 RepID=A0ABW4YRB3_9BACL
MHILIVDDEPIIRKGLIKLIEKFDASITASAASNGVEALQKIEKVVPELILTDIRMPKMDGLELCKIISERRIATNIIVISGFDEFTYAQQCIAYGVKQYLLKPLTEDELYPVLQRIFRYHSNKPLSLSAYEHWLLETEEAVQTADYSRVTKLLEQWKVDYVEKQRNVQQVQQLAIDGLSMLQKRINKQQIYLVQYQFSSQSQSLDNIIANFERELYGFIDQLLAWRGDYRNIMLDEALQYIDNHITENISLPDVAAKIGLTAPYFSWYFKKMMNENFVQYRIRKKIELAIQMLEDPQYKVINIALEAGFPNYNYFSKVFKKSVGCSPSEYRSRIGIL